ncbi:type II secretion system protein N [Noviherbaspirillum saxi]|uniref:Type II secretion system protein GspC N-terminal domain-containing protein n=1 Tax=Noviherbaspirillum saxi TaxID=2320863 RepID=A0A3A3FQU0_9BURK|nr:type II secretion system protein N [Noviherbaspirillum saxi]RJF97574.1 hypothetical protein D3871_02795 [Noviherbaspirillum saxi]
MKRLPLALSFVLFMLLCASIAYWGLQLFKPPLRPVAAPPRAAQPEVRPEAAAALFGGRTGLTQAASNFQLRGVIFSGNARDSVAILSTEGKPAQAVRVDMEVVPGVTVKEVHRGYVVLSDNGVSKRVELPEDAKGGVETTPPVSTSPNPPGQGRNFPPPTRAQAATGATPAPPTPPAAPPVPANQQVQPQLRPPPAPATPVQPAAPQTPQVGAGTPSPTPPLTPQNAPAPPGQAITAPPTVVVTPPPAIQSGVTGAPLTNAPNAVPNTLPVTPPATGSTVPGEPPLQSR